MSAPDPVFGHPEPFESCVRMIERETDGIAVSVRRMPVRPVVLGE